MSSHIDDDFFTEFLRRSSLKESDEYERDLVSRAWSGDMESRRRLVWHVRCRLSPEGPGKISPAVRMWLWEAICALDGLNTWGAKAETKLDDALALLGYEPKRGRPAGETIDEICKKFEIAGAVRFLESHLGKSAAVAAVALSVPMSESAVWASCKSNRKILGLGDPFTCAPVLEKVHAASLSPLTRHEFPEKVREVLSIKLAEMAAHRADLEANG